MTTEEVTGEDYRAVNLANGDERVPAHLASPDYGVERFVATALLDQGFALTGLEEHDSVPWEALPGLMEPVDGGEWRLRDRPWRVPHTYTLTAVTSG